MSEDNRYKTVEYDGLCYRYNPDLDCLEYCDNRPLNVWSQSAVFDTKSDVLERIASAESRQRELAALVDLFDNPYKEYRLIRIGGVDVRYNVAQEEFQVKMVNGPWYNPGYEMITRHIEALAELKKNPYK